MLAAAVPVPDRATVSGLPGALLLTDSVPDADPDAVGVNVTLTAQEAPAASDVPQLLVSPNGPVTPTEAIDTAAEPGFDTGALVSWARERLAGFKCPTGVTVVSELPRNATGKVTRAALREPYWDGRDRRVS